MTFSIITVCKNSESHIGACLDSLDRQTHQDWEHWIVDGGSTDGTVSIVEARLSDRRKLLIDPDSGIYRAMNIGVSKASAEILFFLNSDDRLADDRVLEDIAAIMPDSHGARVLYGDARFSDGRREYLMRQNLVDSRFLKRKSVCHQTVFSTRRVFDLVGGFDERYVLHADYDWFLRAYTDPQVEMRYVNRVICWYFIGGLSSTTSVAERYKWDRPRIASKYFLDAKVKLMVKRLLGIAPGN